jgi:hypothetical protein
MAADGIKQGKNMILNLTQHPATSEQIAQGVVDLQEEVRECLWALLTVNELPGQKEIRDRCEAIAGLIFQTDADNAPAAVMIGGAPWMMPQLVKSLQAAGVVQCLAAFSKRESVEHTDPASGAVTKTAVFRHIGFVECAA